jgi:hypothetical protein
MEVAAETLIKNAGGRVTEAELQNRPWRYGLGVLKAGAAPLMALPTF